MEMKLASAIGKRDMTYISTRKGLSATSAETIFRGLAPDGGLYVPALGGARLPEEMEPTLRSCVEAVMATLFGDLPEDVRAAATDRLLSRFPSEDPIPLVKKGDLRILELFHTATSGDTGSAAMQGFAGVDGTEIVVFYPATGTSRIQRLQMTTPADANVHAVGIRGNFDDAQAAVKRIFADKAIAEEAARRGVTLSSANSINTGRLVPQIAYYVLAVQKLAVEFGRQSLCAGGVDMVVPSGNFGNILAAYYAKLLGSPIRRLVVASNVNDVLARFVRTGVYDPGPTFTVTNSPSMDIRLSSNVERLLWILNDGDCAEVARLMDDLARTGRYELNDAAKKRLAADFDSGVATPEETEAEMRRMRAESGYLIDPHTAVATFVARRLGYPKEGAPCVVAATATPYKFPETCLRAFGEDVLSDPPPCIRELESLPVAQKSVVDVRDIPSTVRALF